MEINNEIRRTKEKEVLLQIEGIYGLLADVIDEVVEYADCNVIEYPDKLMIIQKVRAKYLKFIRDNKPKDRKQQKLFDQ